MIFALRAAVEKARAYSAYAPPTESPQLSCSSHSVSQLGSSCARSAGYQLPDKHKRGSPGPMSCSSLSYVSSVPGPALAKMEA